MALPFGEVLRNPNLKVMMNHMRALKALGHKSYSNVVDKHDEMSDDDFAQANAYYDGNLEVIRST